MQSRADPRARLHKATQVHRSLIVTFYAYKGGTGRTLALANVARYLAEEMGYRVGLVDLDIESPGLVHEPLCESLETSSTTHPNIRDGLLESIDRRKGFLECFIDRFHRVRRGETVLPKINDYVVSLNSCGNGSILLMPTAAGSVSKAPSYGATVEAFMQLLASADSGESPTLGSLPGLVALGLFEEFAQQYNLDFLFLDGRTGTGPFFPVYVYSIPHLLVLFLGLNDQNILGSLSVLNATTDQDVMPAPVFLVASPVPTVGPANLEQRLGFIATQLLKQRELRRLGKDRYIFDLPQNVDYMLPYSDAASFGEVYFPGRYPHSLLARAYRRLASGIEGLVLTERTESVSLAPEGDPALATFVRQAGHLGAPIRIAMEDVHNDLLQSLLAEKFGPEIRPVVQHHPAESQFAPWESLVQIESEDDKRRVFADLPDIVVVPQVYLQTLSEKLGGSLFYDLSELRSSQTTTIDYALLDDNYPNWRRWCSVGQKIMGLPFSVNAMLLCANEEELTPVCEAYWREHRQEPLSDFFVPSNWPALVDLIRSWHRTKDGVRRPFRIVGEGRGLYYEWLNLVLALGGFDILQTEGRLIQEIGLDNPQTIEATKLFVNLARLCPEAQWAKSMGDQITNFAQGKLPLYVGWTDSFRFDWNNGVPTNASVVPLNGKRPSKVKNIRLARCPRDMRYPRTSLVDGWLMTFPKKPSRERLDATLRFAHWFLEPVQQSRLLKRGFPSASGRAVSREIEALKTRRLTLAESSAPNAERSFEVFLDTMKAGTFDGRWVASPKTAVYEAIVVTLSKLIRTEAADIEKELRTLAETVRSELGIGGTE